MSEVDTTMAGSGRGSLLLYAVVRTVVVGWARIWFRLSVEGLERVPTTGAFVIAPVHRSNIDTLVVAALTKRRIRYMGKDSLWKVSWASGLLSALGGFPVSRGTVDREALRRCVDVLEGGEPLVMFPEGERKSGPLVQPLFDGAVYVALKAGVPVVPVGIGGSERAMPKGAKMIRPAKVVLVVGEPIDTAALVGAGTRVARSAVQSVTADLAEELQVLFDRAQVRAG